MYKIYGYNMKSEIYFPQLEETEEKNWDIEVIEGPIPPCPDFNNGIESFFLIKDKKAWVILETGEKFYIENGNKIIVEHSKDKDIKFIRSKIIGNIMSFIFFQRDELSIHGGAIDIGGKGVIIGGESGAGKSSMVTKLLENNKVRFMADDTVRLDINEEVYLYPGFPKQKLCGDIADKFGHDKNELEKINEIRDKYIVDRKDRYKDTNSKLELLFFIRPVEGGEYKVRELQGIEKLMKIRENLYAYSVYDYTDVPPLQMKKLLELTKKVKVIYVERPFGEDVLEKMENEIYRALEME